MELDWNFPHKVRHDEDGAYRWNYNMKENGNNAPLWFMVGICSAIGVPIALIMLVLIWPYGAQQAVLSALGLLAGLVGLPALIWKLLPPDPSFKMTETRIESWPKGKGNNIHHFEDVRRVTLRPDIDRIQLHERLGGLHVYVPQEDYDFVREYILARIPKGTEVLWS